MKKLLITGAASLALAALPMASSLAIQDSLTVTVSESCTLLRQVDSTEWSDSTGGSFSGDLAVGFLQENFGSSTYKVVCNRTNGFKVTAAFTALDGPGTGANDDITFIGEAPTAGGTVGHWAAKLSNNNYIAAENGVLMSNATQTGADGMTETVTYQVSTADYQIQGNYTGTATYTLTNY